MPAPRMTVAQEGDHYTFHLSNRGGLNESELYRLLNEVFRAVNPAAGTPEGERTGPVYQALHDQGPLLFNERVIDPDTHKHYSQLGGLEVTVARLAATLAKLQDLGFEIVEKC